MASGEQDSRPCWLSRARKKVAAKKKILGLNAARLYDIPVPEEC